MSQRIRVVLGVACVVFGAACASGITAQNTSITPVRATLAVADDPDDPAIWINQSDPSRSLLLGTNKVEAPKGGLYVFDMQGNVKQVVAPLDRPNNVDVEYGVAGAGEVLDIAVVTERLQHRLRVFRVSESGVVPIDGGIGLPVMEGETAEAQMPMGIAVYKRPRDGAVFAIVAPKTGGRSNYLWQYRVDIDPSTGFVRGALVRRFGNFSGSGEIEAVAVDDELGYVYFADEEYGIRKWHADPDHPDATRELAVFGRDGFTAQREGIAIVREPGGKGFIVCSDQIAGASELRIFPREGYAGNPHQHDPAAHVVKTLADSTDGLEVSPSPITDLGRLLVMMNSSARTFQFYRWDDLESRW